MSRHARLYSIEEQPCLSTMLYAQSLRRGTCDRWTNGWNITSSGGSSGLVVHAFHVHRLLEAHCLLPHTVARATSHAVFSFNRHGACRAPLHGEYMQDRKVPSSTQIRFDAEKRQLMLVDIRGKP